MSKRRNRVITLQDIARLPVTEVGNKSGFQTRREFYKEQEQIAAREKAAAEERLMAPVRAGEKQLRQAASEHSAKIRSFFSRPASFIVENCENAPVDFYGDYPLLEGARDLQADNSVREEFRRTLASSGCILDDAGQTRLDVYLDVLNYYRNISLASVTSWAIGLERLNALGCFQPGELSGYDNGGAAQPADKNPQTVKPAEPTIDDLLSLDTTTREGFKEACRLAQDLGQIELAPVFQAWAQSLVDNFSLYTTAEDRERITAWFKRNNRRDKRAFDDCRKFMVKQGYWPESALTKEEITARNWESRSERSDTFESKRELRRQLDHFGTKVLG